MNHNIRNIKPSVISMLLLGVVLVCGCTQNNGYLGPLFGSWSIVEITEDGIPVELGDETIFSFQNEIVRVVRLVDPPYSSVTKFGNFTHTDDKLTLMFQPEPTQSGSYMYMTPDWLYFPKGESKLIFEVRKLTGSKMELSLDSEGRIMIYSFEKTW